MFVWWEKERGKVTQQEKKAMELVRVWLNENIEKYILTRKLFLGNNC